MSITKTELKTLGNQVTCTVGSVESGVGYFYCGTDTGDVLKYNTQTEAMTTIKNVGQKILSVALYSGTLWMGLADGKFISLTTS
ncbi:MAG: hypothetical protein Q8P12_01035 [bacterium]|nr:hypothetical protein [bacterium]